MSTFIYYQIYVVLAACYGGIIIGLLYDTYRVFRNSIKMNKAAKIIQDIIFWTTINIVALAVLFYSNSGILRWYSFLGFILGIFMYNVFLSTLIERVLKKFIATIFKIYRSAKRKLSWITTAIYRLVRFPFIKIALFLKPITKWFEKLLNIPKKTNSRVVKYVKTIFSKKIKDKKNNV